jgi:hypothetical protein
MDWVVAMRLLGFAALGLLLPQAVGFAGYRWTRTKALPLKIATILIPPLLFFFHRRSVLDLPSAIHPRGGALRLRGVRHGGYVHHNVWHSVSRCRRRLRIRSTQPVVEKTCHGQSGVTTCEDFCSRETSN